MFPKDVDSLHEKLESIPSISMSPCFFRVQGKVSCSSCFIQRQNPVRSRKLIPQNRWVILADLIPLDKVEEKYAQLFVTNNERGSVKFFL